MERMRFAIIWRDILGKRPPRVYDQASRRLVELGKAPPTTALFDSRQEGDLSLPKAVEQEHDGIFSVEAYLPGWTL